MLSVLRNKKSFLTIVASTLMISGSAFAIYAKLKCSLVSADVTVGGSGIATLDQSKLPQTGAAFTINIKGVALPTGTVLQVRLDRCTGATCVIGYVSITNGAASASYRLPTYMQFGRYDTVAVFNSLDTNNPVGRVLTGKTWSP